MSMVAHVRAGRVGVLDNVRTFGIVSGAHDLAVRALNRVGYLRILKGVVITAPGESPSTLSYRHGVAEPEPLRAIAQDPAYELDTVFLQQAFAKGDECYAIWDGDVLASYGWYSTAPTRMRDD